MNGEHIYYDRTTPHLLDTKSPLNYFSHTSVRKRGPSALLPVIAFFDPTPYSRLITLT